jgi:uncharacterized membrane protein
LRLRWIILLVIILFGFWIRLHHLSRPLQGDEAISFLKYASQPYATIVSLYDDVNNHILNSLLMRTELLLAGAEPTVLRLHVFAAGILLIPAVFVMAARLWDKDMGLLAAGLTAASGGLIEMSVTARAYSMITLFTVFLVIVAQRLLTRPAARLWIIYAILTAVGFYAVPLMIMPVAVVSLWLLLRIVLHFRGPARWHMLLRFSLTLGVGMALTLLLYLPVFLGHSVTSGMAQDRISVIISSSSVLNSLIEVPRPLLQFLSQGMPRWLRYGLFIMAAIGAILSLRQKRIPLWLLSIGVSILVIIFLNIGSSRIRYWTWIIPFYIIMMAVGTISVMRWLRLNQQYTVVWAALLLTVLNIGNMISNEGLSDGTAVVILTFEVEETAEYLAAHAQPNELLLTNIQTPHSLEFYLAVNQRSDIQILLTAPTDVALPAVNDRRWLLTYAEDEVFAERMWEGYQIDVNRPNIHFETVEIFGNWALLELKVDS